jgi:hypothetical protein
MTVWIEAYPPLPAYAIQATSVHRLVEDTTDEANGQKIVHIESGREDIQLLFRADGVVIFDFSKCRLYSGGEIPRFQLDEGGRWPREIERRYLKPREDIRERRAIYVNAFLACFNAALTPTGRLAAPFSSMNHACPVDTQAYN